MAVNLLNRMTVQQARETLELSFAQYQADRDVVELAKQVRDQQASLDGYQRAIKRATGADKQRWRRRYQQLKRQTDRQMREVTRRTSTIARVFDRVVTVLEHLGYVRDEQRTYVPTSTGQQLRRIYGERDLLVTDDRLVAFFDARLGPEVT